MPEFHLILSFNKFIERQFKLPKSGITNLGQASRTIINKIGRPQKFTKGDN